MRQEKKTINILPNKMKIRSSLIYLIISVVFLLSTSVPSFSFWWWFSSPKSHPFSSETLNLKKKVDNLRVECFVYKVRNKEDLLNYINKYKTLKDSVEEANIPKNESLFIKALIDFDLFSIHYDWYPNITNERKEKEAYEFITSAEKWLEMLVKEDIVNSDILRLRGEISIRKVVFIKDFSAIDFLQRGKLYLEEALKYDSNNARALLVLGNWYMFAPEIGGGNPSVALKLYKKAHDKGGDYEKFMSHVCGGIAYYSYLKDRAKALSEVEKGLAMANDHPWLLYIREGMKNNRSVIIR